MKVHQAADSKRQIGELPRASPKILSITLINAHGQEPRLSEQRGFAPILLFCLLRRTVFFSCLCCSASQSFSRVFHQLKCVQLLARIF
jgi:hypothetical protein